MKEVEPDNKWQNDETVPPVPSLEELILGQISLLMRIYDVQMGILNSLDEDTANKVFEAHEEGKTFNPPVMIPDITNL